jgi:hypothetical protein
MSASLEVHPATGGIRRRRTLILGLEFVEDEPSSGAAVLKR